MAKIVYLAGAITNVADANIWRTEATVKLTKMHFEVINPVLIEAKTMTDDEVVILDYRAILKSSVVLVDARRPSWGTAMEILFAYQNDIPTIAWGADPDMASPWLRRHVAHMELTLDEVLFELGAIQ